MKKPFPPKSPAKNAGKPSPKKPAKPMMPKDHMPGMPMMKGGGKVKKPC